MKKTIIAPLFLVFQLQYVIGYFDISPDYAYDDCIPNYYDYNSPVEVWYLPPEQVRNIIDFLNKFSSTRTPEIAQTTQSTIEETTTLPNRETTTLSTRHTEETTTPTTRHTEETTIGITTAFTTITTPPSTEPITTLKENTGEEVEDPIEDVINSGPVEKEEVTTPLTNIEIPIDPLEETDNEDEEDFERDSEEDILSIQKTKPEKIVEPTTSEDENNSKPKDIYRWF